MSEADLATNLPNPELDRLLSPCPRCHAKFNIPSKRKGPTTLFFTQNKQSVVCLNCFYRAAPGKSQEQAMQNWEKGAGERLMQKLRLEKGLTRAELADLAGVCTDTIARIERNTYVGSDATRKKIATALGIEPNQL